nr:alpha/beta hydrolase [Pseudomonas sp. P818]
MPHLPSRTWIRALVGITVALGTFEATRRYRQLASAPALSDTSRALGIDGHHVQAGPWRLFTRSVGAADAPVVVLVHGLVISSRYMEPLARALADNGYRVLAPDLPGYGESATGTPRRVLSVEQLADVLDLWLSACAIDKATFIGNSYGCQILTALAVRHPQRVERLVLQGPTVDPAARSLLPQLWRAVRNGRRERQRSSAAIGRIDYAKAGVWRVLGSIRQLLHYRIEDHLAAIEAPCLVVQGSRDPVAPPHWGEAVAARLPKGRLCLVEGATHTMNYVHPHSFAQLIDDFLREGRGAAEVAQ